MEKEIDIENVCWKLFEKSGQIKDYLFYKSIKNQREEELNGKLDNNKSHCAESDTLSRQ